MALRRPTTALNNVNNVNNINKKERPLVFSRRPALGNIGNTNAGRNAGAEIVGKKLEKVVEDLKPQQKLAKSIIVSSEISSELIIHERKEEIAYSVQQLNLNSIEDIDEGDENTPHLVSEWVNDIYDYLRELEVRYPIKCEYLADNNIIKPRMRAILVDWLNQVHMRFKLLQETLYLTVAIIDRLLQDLEVPRQKLQLVGITAMLVASKYEEIHAPTIDDFIHICDNAYSRSDIRQMEIVILNQLNFSIGRPLPLHFLRRFSKAAKATACTHAFAKYFMEVTLTHHELVHYAPSHLAAAGLCLSLKMLRGSSWDETLVHYTKYTEKELVPLMEKMASIVTETDGVCKVVRSKYAGKNYGKLSTSKYLMSEVIVSLAKSGKSKLKSKAAAQN